jgi:mannose-6-phosphate isomerase-like protein (cupin superfamily)
MNNTAAFVRRAQTLRAFKIAATDSNYFALLFDPFDESRANSTSVIEIFTVGGRTPPNNHQIAHEMFYVLKGEGRARCQGESFDLRQGDSLMLKPGAEHVVENTGTTKLYCLTVMAPNEGFAELIRAGVEVTLDEEDRAVVLGRASSF